MNETLRAVLYIIFIAAFGVQMGFLPLYLKAGWPYKNKRSLKFKIICSSMFVINVVVANILSGGFKGYGLLVLVGMFFGWLGDFLLHVKVSTKFFILGMFSFLVGHIFYAVAFTYERCLLTGKDEIFSIWELVALAVLLLVGAKLFLKRLLEPKNRKLLIPGTFYFIAILTMLVKAVSLSVACLSLGKSALFAVFVSMAAMSFVSSDAILAMLKLRIVKRTFEIKSWNMVTYYLAQSLISASVLIPIVL